ncbi:hypothetical protein DPEC_G00148680 [Dallia pectoralis]|uniref:Uncharacterized protein n=1 Tax=Dallia pectoralis TaxID=75939 RepID=A0ACC2GJ44_DALPE|nr:hypothetical protein DPEC_G00148680 [Dallia pectoralis]
MDERIAPRRLSNPRVLLPHSHGLFCRHSTFPPLSVHNLEQSVPDPSNNRSASIEALSPRENLYCAGRAPREPGESQRSRMAIMSPSVPVCLRDTPLVGAGILP